MTSPLDHIDNIVDPECLAETCEKQGCTVGLEGAPHPFRLIDMDHPDSPAGRDARRRRVRQRGVRRCDYLFIGEDDGDTTLYVVPLELKSSGIRTNTVSSQLRAGARVAERIVPGSSSIRFVPVAAHGGRLHRKQIKDLARPGMGVPFRGEEYPIQLIRCGEPLAAALR